MRRVAAALLFIGIFCIAGTALRADVRPDRVVGHVEDSRVVKTHHPATSRTAITSQPVAVTSAVGGAAVFHVQATGTALRYHWSVRTRGSTLSEPLHQRRNVLRIKNVAAEDAGDRYRVQVTGKHGSATSQTATLTVTMSSAGQTTDTEAMTAAAMKATAIQAQFGSGTASYALSVTAPNGSGAPAWKDKCAVVDYAIDETGAPASYDGLVTGGLQRYTAATGISFAQSSFNAADPYGNGVSLVFSVHDASTDTDFTAGDVIAYAGPGVLETDTNQDFGTPPPFEAFVVFDDTQLTTLGAGELAAAMTHEIGHTFNLAHTQDPRQVMYPDIGSGESDALEDGDLAGLARTILPGPACG